MYSRTANRLQCVASISGPARSNSTNRTQGHSQRRTQVIQVACTQTTKSVSTNRRQCLQAAVVAPLAAWLSGILGSQPALAITEGLVVTPLGPKAELRTTPQGTVFNSLEFTFAVPDGFKYAPPPAPKRSGPQLTIDQGPAESPIKARFATADNSQNIVVIVRQASEVQQTFFQLTDISQWGDVDTAGKLVVPKGGRVLSSGTDVVQLPPKDTGTVLGVVERPPLNVYRYEYLSSGGLHLSIAALAQKGKLYILAASCSDSQWQEAGPTLEGVAGSFRPIIL